MKVVYYTATHFLDISLEVINTLKNNMELHVLIEITESTKSNNLINIDQLPAESMLIHPKEIIREEEYDNFRSYFEGVKSVNFVVHSTKGYRSMFKASYCVLQHVKRVKPDVFHFESILIRTLGLLPAVFFSKKIVINVHDPAPHTGEHDWRQQAINFLFYNLPINKSFLFYSEFARTSFGSRHFAGKGKFVLAMHRYSYYTKLLAPPYKEPKHILFFGRLSAYKGIEYLLKAIPMLLETFPNELFVIAGKSYQSYSLDKGQLNKCKDHVIVYDRYIPTAELVKLIVEAKFVVCPYIDASQSGVVMTAFALNRPVIATTVGAMPEYIKDMVNGLLVPPKDESRLAESMIKALRDDQFAVLANNIAGANSADDWRANFPVLEAAYK
jgi:glycosyltransferase involved in cell wall biosynthesis